MDSLRPEEVENLGGEVLLEGVCSAVAQREIPPRFPRTCWGKHERTRVERPHENKSTQALLQGRSRALKARARAKEKEERATPSGEAVAQAQRGPASKDLADFSNEYSGKMLTNDGVLYVNKAYVISVKPLELTPLAQRAAAQRGQA